MAGAAVAAAFTMGSRRLRRVSRGGNRWQWRPATSIATPGQGLAQQYSGAVLFGGHRCSRMMARHGCRASSSGSRGGRPDSNETRAAGGALGGPGEHGSEGSSSDKSSLIVALRQLDGTTRYQLAVLAGGTCVMSLGFGTIAPILPLFASQWGDMGATGVGLVIAAPALAKLLLNTASGRRADTHGRVPMMVAGGAINACGNFLTAFAQSITAVTASRLVCGVGSAGNGPASQAYLADVTSKFPKHRGAVMGTLGSIGMLSYGFGPAVGGLLAEVWGPGICFGVVGAACALTAVAEATLPETLHQQPMPAKANASSSGSSSPVVEGQLSHTVGSESADHTATAAVAAASSLSIAELFSRVPRLRGLLVMDAAIYTGWAVWLGVVPTAYCCSKPPFEDSVNRLCCTDNFAAILKVVTTINSSVLLRVFP